MQSSIRQFPLAAGVDEGGDPKTQAPGTLLSLMNGVWRKDNRVDKRFGTAGKTKNIVGGGTLGAAARLIVRGAELALTDGTNLYSLSSNGWISRGRHPEVGLEWSTVVDATLGVGSFETAYLTNGQAVDAWVVAATGNASGGLYYQIRDTITGGIVTPPTSIGGPASVNIRVLASGNTWVIVWVNFGVIKAFTSTGSTTLRSDASTSAPSEAMDAIVMGTDFVLGYMIGAGGIRLDRYSIATTPVLAATSTVTGESSTGILAISLAGAPAETLYVTYAYSIAVKFACANPSTMAQTFAPTVIQTSVTMTTPVVAAVRESSTSCLLLYSFVDTSHYQAGLMQTCGITSSGVATITQGALFQRPLTRPLAFNGRFYAACVTNIYNTSFAGSGFPGSADTFLIDVTRDQVASEPFREVGKIDALVGGTFATVFVTTPAVVSSTKMAIGMPFMATPAPGTVGTRCGTRLVLATVGASRPPDMWRSVNLGPEAYVAAGVLTSYDGVEALGYGFCHGPYLDPPNIAISTTGGVMLAGSYIYNVTAERRSAVGVLHRSPVGVALKEVTTGSTSSVVLALIQPTLGRSMNNPPLVPIYRSTASDPLAIEHRATLEGQALTFVDNSLSTTYPNTLTDTFGDASVGGVALATRPALYTQGGELEDTQPVSSRTLMLHRNRLWSLNGDRRTVSVSKDASVNPGIAPGFYPTQAVTFPEDLVALASMDEKAIFFSATRPYYLLGDGPDSTGANSDYAAPTPIQSDVGCSNPRSVVSTPDGIMFLTTRGFYILSRQLELTLVGKFVEDTLAAFPNITSAVLVPSSSQVRWTCNNAAGTAGRVIVFDYRTKQWSVFSYYDADAAVAGTPIADAVMWNGVWTFVTPGGKVYVEDATTFLDNGTTWVPCSGELAWLSEGGPLGFQHIRRASILADRLTDCDLTLKFRFNHAASYAQSYTWTSDKLAAFHDAANVEMRVGSQNGASPRCRAFGVAWQDAAPTGAGAVVGTGQGINVSAFGIEFIPKVGMDRRSAKART